VRARARARVPYMNATSRKDIDDILQKTELVFLKKRNCFHTNGSVRKK